MITRNFTVQVLEPSEGFVLTQAEDVDLMNRVFSKKVYLGVNDSVDNWKEITEAEQKEMEVEIDAMVKEMQLPK